MATHASNSPVIRFGAYEADPRTGELRKHGIRIKLQDQPFAILMMLLNRPGDLVTREQIRQKLWPADTFVDFDHSLNTAIRRLRDALSDSADNPRFIETLPRRGYRFIGPAERRSATNPPLEAVAFAHGTAQASADSPAEAPFPAIVEGGSVEPPMTETKAAALAAARLPKHTLAVVTLLMIALALTALVAWRFWPRASAIDSLAVLPLVNETKDPKLDYLADGIAESIIDDLSQVAALKVMSRNSAFHYRGANVNPTTVAHALNVRAVLLGALRLEGDTVHVSIELVDTRDQRQLWGAQYGVKREDLAGFQQDIPTRVSEALRLRLSGAERDRVTRPGTRNSSAYDLYLRGRHAISKRTLDDIDRGLSFFQQAVDLDQGYANAYVGIAAAYGMLPFYGGMQPKQAYARAAAAVKRAQELDPDSADIMLQSGYQSLNRWEWQAAEKQIRGAIERMPNSSDAHHAYMLLLQAEGRNEEAVPEARLATELDPLWPVAARVFNIAHFWAGHYDEALRLARAADPPNHFVIAMVYEQQGKYREAVAELQQARDQLPDDIHISSALAHAYALAGNRHEARIILEDLLKRRHGRYVPAGLIAIVYAGLGDTASTLHWLQTAYEEGDPTLLGFQRDPRLSSLYDLEEFKELVRKVLARA